MSEARFQEVRRRFECYRDLFWCRKTPVLMMIKLSHTVLAQLAFSAKFVTASVLVADGAGA